MGKSKLLLQAGPYLGFGVLVNERHKVGGEKMGSPTGWGETDLNSFDFGLGAGVGIQFGNLQTVLGYNFGLTNIADVKPYKWKNSGFALTLTYLFGR